MRAPKDTWQEVAELIGSLYQITGRLESLFPNRKFTLDGHLVGSIGEVAAAHMFNLRLLPTSSPTHDAKTNDGRKVQVKLTQGKRGVALRAKPEQLLVLRLTPEGNFEVIYNGNGGDPWSRAGKKQSNGQRFISLFLLRNIDESVPDHERLRQTGFEFQCLNLAAFKPDGSS